jgi:ArsR family transcriptional regulator
MLNGPGLVKARPYLFCWGADLERLIMHSVQFFKALADPTRVRLVHLLRDHELNVGEIVQILGMGQSRVSRHLKILADCGLLVYRRDGLWVFYSTPDQGKSFAFLQALEPFLAAEEDLKMDLARAKEVICERTRHTKRFFDGLAANWADAGREALGGFDVTLHVKRLIQNCTSVVDLGCGPGRLLAVLKDHSRQVIGVDNSAKMLDLARQHLHPDQDISLRLGDLAHLPLRDQECDCAVMSLVLHHLVRPGLALAETARILSLRGRLILAEFTPHEHEAMRNLYHDRWLGIAPKEIESWLAWAGLELAQRYAVPAEQGLEVIVYQAVKG